MQVAKNTLKVALANGEVVVGLWSSSGSNVVAEVIAYAGYDWIVLDTEHTLNETPALVSQMQAISASGTPVIVRPAWNDMVLIKRILDIGAQSLVIPYVQNAEEAGLAVSYTRYPPEGVRGVAGSTRAAGYGRIKDYLHRAGDEICVIAQVETGEALQNIEAIAGVPGVDCVFIGPSDLSASMGHINNASHEDVQSAIQSAINSLKNAGTPGGILAFNPDDAKRYIDWGFQFVAITSDTNLLVKGSEALLKQFKG